MEKGDIYTKHIRGSQYSFANGRIYYRYPNGARNYVIGNANCIYDDLCDIRGTYGGRLRINEKKEIIVFKSDGNNLWTPYYVGKLPSVMKFDGIDNDPDDLRPGLLWTGFASHHGSRFLYKTNGRIFFKEMEYDENSIQTVRKYPVNDVDQDLLKRLNFFKIDSGRFYINEYHHIWAPVPEFVINNYYDSDIIHIDDIKDQFKNMTREQKNTIAQYRDSPHTGKDNRWYPIYIGKYEKNLQISRDDHPHRYYGDEY